jgi:DNA (cytosine-5)-methyltransferase 1
VADADGSRLQGYPGHGDDRDKPGWVRSGTAGHVAANSAPCGPSGAADFVEPSPTNGFWRDPDWLGCQDDRWRPVEPGTFPLADGVSGRVGRLRGYGNAIVPQVAAAFVTALFDAVGGEP